MVFTLFVPAVVGGLVPQELLSDTHRRPGWWQAGWLILSAGALLYVLCLLHFLAANGTPAIFFTRHLRFLWGEEPQALVGTVLIRCPEIRCIWAFCWPFSARQSFMHRVQLQFTARSLLRSSTWLLL